MGSKKKKKQQKQKQQQNASAKQPSQTTLQVTELLCELLDVLDQMKQSDVILERVKELADLSSSTKIEQDPALPTARNSDSDDDTDSIILLHLEQFVVSLQSFFNQLQLSITQFQPQIDDVIHEMETLLFQDAMKRSSVTTTAHPSPLMGVVMSIRSDIHRSMAQIKSCRSESLSMLSELYIGGHATGDGDGDGSRLESKAAQGMMMRIVLRLKDILKTDMTSPPWREVLEFLREQTASMPPYLGSAQQALDIEKWAVRSSNFDDIRVRPPSSEQTHEHAHQQQERTASLHKSNESQAKVLPPEIEASITQFIFRNDKFGIHDAMVAQQHVHVILLVGSEGAGKTTMCHNIAQWASHHNIQCTVPNLAFDLNSRVVGGLERSTYALLFSSIPSTASSILVLDDIESIVGASSKDDHNTSSEKSKQPSAGGASENHLQVRQRASFYSMLDAFERQLSPSSLSSPLPLSRPQSQFSSSQSIVIICTASQDISHLLSRVDVVHELSPPSCNDRKAYLTSFFKSLGIGSDLDQSTAADTERAMEKLAEATAGMSFSELSRRCRDARLKVDDTHTNPTDEDQTAASSKYLQNRIINALQHEIRSYVPSSLKNVANDNFLDVNILSAADLLSGQHNELMSGTGSFTNITSTSTGIPFPLFGTAANAAWSELQRLIVAPFCYGPAIYDVLCTNGNDTVAGDGSSSTSASGSSGIEIKQFCGGVILSGSPGTGKTTLAYHCGRVAATILPTMQFIDVNCAALIRKEVGGSERAVSRLFQAARKAAPCILLMDGIENIAAVRGNDPTTEGTMDRVLSTLLTELDGVDDDDAGGAGGDGNGKSRGIAVIAVSHNVDWIDPALKRPGRLEKTLTMDLLESSARYQLILQQLQQLHRADDPRLESVVDEHDGNNSNGVPASDNSPISLEECRALAELVATNTDDMPGASVLHIFNKARLKVIEEVLALQTGSRSDVESVGTRIAERHFRSVLGMMHQGN